MNYRQAVNTDLTAIQKLLESNDLPASDCAEHIGNFIVAESDSVVAVVVRCYCSDPLQYNWITGAKVSLKRYLAC